ncbi:MAG: hypothetical protein ABEJ04_01630 [Halobacteriaceae archaeon]
MSRLRPRLRVRPRTRAQANLLSLGLALLFLTGGVALALGVTAGAFAGAHRDPAERRVAVGLAGRLVAADSAVTNAPNALNASRLDGMSASALREAFPVARGHDVRVTVGGETVVEAGDPDGGTTVTRLVVVERRRVETLRPPVTGTTRVRLPARSARATVTVRDVDPPVVALRVNGRTVRRATDGLNGSFSLALPRGRRSTVTVVADGTRPADSVAVTYFPWSTRETALEVTVDA